MTEITVSTDQFKSQKIDWIAFICALVAAPIVVAILGFWAAVPIFALFFGTPTYLLFGAPVFAYAIRKHDANAYALAGWGFLANILSIPAVYVFAMLQGEGIEMTTFIVGNGCYMAPIWGLAFGFLYRQLRISDE